MRFLACAGANGNETAVKKMLDVAKQREELLILFAGGIANPDSDVHQKEDFISRFFQLVGRSGLSTVVIPGPYDAPLWEFLRAALNTEVVFPNISVAHATPVSKGDIAVSGIGGLITEFEDATEPIIKYSHTSAEYFFRTLWQTTKPIKVLMLSEPPPGELAGSGGNSFVREFVLNYHPALCVVAGKKENRGFEQEPHGFVVNPGQLVEGSAAWIDQVARRVYMLDI